jgi:signal peptidase I
MNKSILRTASSASFLILVFLAWWMLAPPQLGGRTSYAVIYGISMEPHFHGGDLVLLRQQPSYQVGQIVGYHSNKLGKPVMHRIIKIDESGHYYFKGDNNNFVDPEHPLETQLFGSEWVRLPGVGSALEKVHSPRNAAILGGLVALFVLGGGSARAKRRRRRYGDDSWSAPVASAAPPAPEPTPVAPEVHHPAPEVHHAAHVQEAVPAINLLPAGAEPTMRERLAAAASTATPAGSSASGDDRSWVPRLGAVLGVVGVAGIAAMSIFGILAFTRPPAAVRTQPDLYVQHGLFDYSANAPIGPVYDHSPLHAGDALFASIVHRFDVSFRYHVSSEQPMHLAGHSLLDAKLTDGSGWTRKLHIKASTPFSGNATTVTGAINLDSVREAVSKFERATGQLNPSSYKLEITPRMALRGIVGDQMVDDKFAPTLTMLYDNGRLRLASPDNADEADPLRPMQSGVGTTTHTATLGSMGVSTARQAAMIGLPLSMLFALLGGFLFYGSRSRDEVASIRRRYGAWLIDVAAVERPAHVERHVESIDDLARIAERYERLILHEQRGKLHSFVVEDAGIVYRYDASDKGSWPFDRHAGVKSEPEAATLVNSPSD